MSISNPAQEATGMYIRQARLIITDGGGYHQIKDQPRQTIKKGDVIKCPPNVEHWHGAGLDKGLQQMYILPKTEKGIVTWLQKVTDEEYHNK